jgi:hypothetical protein
VLGGREQVAGAQKGAETSMYEAGKKSAFDRKGRKDKIKLSAMTYTLAFARFPIPR